MNDYLWDRSGSDPEVEKLEELLSPLAHRGRPPELRRRGPNRVLVQLAGLAAALVLGIGVISTLRAAEPAYSVSGPGVAARSRVGAWIPASDVERVIQIGDFGTVTAEAGAELRVLAIRGDLHKLRLERGTLHATISADAKPRLFQVETPATTCVDLGCKYTLTVDAEGRTHVAVSTGKVAFEDRRREVFVPRGAICSAERGRPASTPRHPDAPADLVEALARYDAKPPGFRAAEGRAVAAAVKRLKDTLALWHLLQDPEDAVLEAGLSRLLELAHHPDDADAARTRTRDPASREAWKEYLYSEWTR